MADHEFSLTKLSVEVSNAEDKLTAVINFTVADETYKVTLPDSPHDDIRQFLSRLGYAVSRSHQATDLVGGDSFTVDLIV